MKLALIRDVLDVVLDEGTAARDRPMRGAGGFEVLHDEAGERSAAAAAKPRKRGR